MLWTRNHQGGSVAWIEDNWGNLASAVGLGVSVIGFGIAIYQIRRSRAAAVAAREAAQEARAALARNLTIADLTRVRERIQSIKDLHVSQQWQRAWDRYQDIRELLVEIRTRHQNLTASQRRIIQNAIRQIRAMEEAVQTTLIDNSRPDMREFNQMLSNVQSTLIEAEIQLQQST